MCGISNITREGVLYQHACDAVGAKCNMANVLDNVSLQLKAFRSVKEM